MTKKETADCLEKINRALEQKRLKEAFDFLTVLLSKLQDWHLTERMNDLEDVYERMLNYLVDGIQDPEREKVFLDLTRSVYQLTDLAELQIKTTFDPAFFFDRRRSYLASPVSSQENLIRNMDDIMGKITLLSLPDDENIDGRLEAERKKETVVQNIFYAILFTEFKHPDTTRKWAETFNNPLYPGTLPCLMVTAATLSLLETFDEQKAILLFEAAENKNEEIRLRALTGIVLFLRRYDPRIALYPSITGRLQHLAEDNGFIRQIRQILIQFIFSHETEKISRRITDEIIPEMLKKTSLPNSKFRLEELFGEPGVEDRNPEWQDLVREAGMEEKMQEISELQLEGADVMHSSFIHMKHYNFFQEWSSWFIPFTLPPDFLKDKEVTGLGQTLLQSTMVCNSDKYSLLLSILRMPETARKMTMEKLSIESEAVREMLKTELNTNSTRINFIIRQYIQDLYRFYKVHPRRKDFNDIFELKPEFYQVSSIAQLIDNREDLFIIGEFYFNKNYFEEAAGIYSHLLKENPNNSELYQKKAYCLQMQNHWEEALDNYLKAELLNADNSWIIKKIAHCYRILKQPEKALPYYKKAEYLHPGNLSLQLNTGHCYLELKNYGEALKSYFKVEYLDKNKQKAWRSIAWCSFLSGKYEQAWEYFEKIMETTPTATDYLNAGHTQLTRGNNKEAMQLYLLSLKSPGNSIEKFIESFTDDIPDLIQAGIKKDDIPFFLDRIMYDL